MKRGSQTSQPSLPVGGKCCGVTGNRVKGVGNEDKMYNRWSETFSIKTHVRRNLKEVPERATRTTGGRLPQAEEPAGPEANGGRIQSTRRPLRAGVVKTGRAGREWWEGRPGRSWGVGSSAFLVEKLPDG